MLSTSDASGGCGAPRRLNASTASLPHLQRALLKVAGPIHARGKGSQKAKAKKQQPRLAKRQALAKKELSKARAQPAACGARVRSRLRV